MVSCGIGGGCQPRTSCASFYNIPAVSALLRLFVSVIRVVVMAAVLMSFERVYGSGPLWGAFLPSTRRPPWPLTLVRKNTFGYTVTRAITKYFLPCSTNS